MKTLVIATLLAIASFSVATTTTLGQKASVTSVSFNSKPVMEEVSPEIASKTIAILVKGLAIDHSELFEKEVQDIFSEAGIHVVFNQSHWEPDTFTVTITAEKYGNAAGYTPVENEGGVKTVSSHGYVSATRIEEVIKGSKNSTIQLAGMISQNFARALGRATAHEVIHWLNNSTSHSDGIMKQCFDDRDLFYKRNSTGLTIDSKLGNLLLTNLLQRSELAKRPSSS